jgi:hypothetical protein
LLDEAGKISLRAVELKAVKRNSNCRNHRAGIISEYASTIRPHVDDPLFQNPSAMQRVSADQAVEGMAVIVLVCIIRAFGPSCA